MSILKKIFSVNLSKDKKQRIIYICGFKFCKTRYLPMTLRQVDNIVTVINYCTDLTKIPQARGTQLMIQQSSLCVLNRMAQILKKHNLKWWLDSGTLIGYIRHNGFIPWDDDIDIAMMREDYTKACEVLMREFPGDGFWASKKEIIRLMYKDTPAQVDIFPMDRGDTQEPPTGAAHAKFAADMTALKHRMRKNLKEALKNNQPSDNVVAMALQERDEILLHGKPALANGYLFFGAETGVGNRCVFSYDDVYPLKKVNFMGIDTYIPNNSEYYLYAQYGDFMNLPKARISPHVDIASRLTTQTFKDCQYLIKHYMPKASAKRTGGARKK